MIQFARLNYLYRKASFRAWSLSLFWLPTHRGSTSVRCLLQNTRFLPWHRITGMRDVKSWKGDCRSRNSVKCSNYKSSCHCSQLPRDEQQCLPNVIRGLTLTVLCRCVGSHVLRIVRKRNCKNDSVLDRIALEIYRHDSRQTAISCSMSACVAPFLRFHTDLVHIYHVIISALCLSSSTRAKSCAMKFWYHPSTNCCWNAYVRFGTTSSSFTGMDRTARAQVASSQ